MSLAAFASLRPHESKSFYDRERAEAKRHEAALICLARRCCNVIIAMLRTGKLHRSKVSKLDILAEQAAGPS